MLGLTRKPLLLLSATLWLSLLLPSSAFAGAYEIEIIVFQHRNAVGQDKEFFDADPGRPDLSGAATIGVSKGYAQLSNLQLGRLWDRLSSDPDFQPLLHKAWRQPAFSRGSARSTRIADDVTYELEPTTTLENGQQLIDNSATAALGTLNTPRVEGKITLTRRQSLYMAPDLVFLAPAKGGPNRLRASQRLRDDQVQAYRLQQKRKIHTGEVHYFDHPYFGILARVVWRK